MRLRANGSKTSRWPVWGSRRTKPVESQQLYKHYFLACVSEESQTINETWNKAFQETINSETMAVTKRALGKALACLIPLWSYCCWRCERSILPVRPPKSSLLEALFTSLAISKIDSASKASFRITRQSQKGANCMRRQAFK